MKRYILSILCLTILFITTGTQASVKKHMSNGVSTFKNIFHKKEIKGSVRSQIMTLNKKANLLMDCDKYSGDCHTCVLANCKFENRVCSDKPDELERGLKSDSDEDDKKKVSEKEALTVAEFMKEGAKCKDVKKLCDYV